MRYDSSEAELIFGGSIESTSHPLLKPELKNVGVSPAVYDAMIVMSRRRDSSANALQQ